MFGTVQKPYVRYRTNNQCRALNPLIKCENTYRYLNNLKSKKISC